MAGAELVPGGTGNPTRLWPEQQESADYGDTGPQTVVKISVGSVAALSRWKNNIIGGKMKEQE